MAAKTEQVDVAAMLEKLPGMDDKVLKALRDNAERLEIVGTPAQKAGAAILLPAIDDELAKRQALKRKPKVKRNIEDP